MKLCEGNESLVEVYVLIIRTNLLRCYSMMRKVLSLHVFDLFLRNVKFTPWFRSQSKNSNVLSLHTHTLYNIQFYNHVLKLEVDQRCISSGSYISTKLTHSSYTFRLCIPNNILILNLDNHLDKSLVTVVFSVNNQLDQ